MSAKKTRIRNIFSQLETSGIQKNGISTSPNKTRPITRSSSLGGSLKSRKNRSKVKETTSTVIDLTQDENLEGNDIHFKNWTESFAPSNLEELTIHPKKLQELQNWFLHCDSVKKKNPAQICLLTGPSGSGKTAAVRVCAETNKCEVQEWINPVDQEMVYTLGDQYQGDNYNYSQVEAFKSFLLRASRYKTLFNRYNKTLLLVEDFPNVLIKDSAKFEEILRDYKTYGKSPLVFIVADSKSKKLNISYNLFTDQLKMLCCIEHISFNPIATTLMQKAMKRFSTIMKNEHADTHKVPPSNIIESIILTSQGDIRNALVNLHFSSLKGAPTIQVERRTKTIENLKKKKEHNFKSIGRDESITMMHALGRVLNPKYNNENKLTHCPEDITEHFIMEPTKFIEFIHANYLPHFKDIGQVVKTINDLTESDIMLCEYRNDLCSIIGLNLAIRSMMVSNSSPVSAWLPIRGPKRLTILQRPIGNETFLIDSNSNVTMKNYATDYSTFVKIIAKNVISDRTP